VLVTLNKRPKIKLDWEHTEYKWISLDDLNNFNVVASFQDGYKKIE